MQQFSKPAYHWWIKINNDLSCNSHSWCLELTHTPQSKYNSILPYKYKGDFLLAIWQTTPLSCAGHKLQDRVYLLHQRQANSIWTSTELSDFKQRVWEAHVGLEQTRYTAAVMLITNKWILMTFFKSTSTEKNVTQNYSHIIQQHPQKHIVKSLSAYSCNTYNNAIAINTAIKVLAVVLESFHRALLITADGLVSLLLHLFSGTLGVVSTPRK